MLFSFHKKIPNIALCYIRDEYFVVPPFFAAQRSNEKGRYFRIGNICHQLRNLCDTEVPRARKKFFESSHVHIDDFDILTPITWGNGLAT
jgi:hypothetical protein